MKNKLYVFGGYYRKFVKNSALYECEAIEMFDTE